jgi:hypothetical protein
MFILHSWPRLHNILGLINELEGGVPRVKGVAVRHGPQSVMPPVGTPQRRPAGPKAEHIPMHKATSSPSSASSPGWTRRGTLGAGAALVVFWCALAFAWTVSDAVVPWDSKNHFYPMLRFLGAALAQGEWPLWNPFHFSGHPTVADPQSLLFTPTMLLFAALSPAASMEAFDIAVLAHLLLAGFATLALFARRGWHPAGAVLAAMIVMIGGSASARLQHTGIIISYAFFVPALLMLDIALERRSWRWGLGFAVTAALMTIGRDQIAFLFGLSLFGFVGWEMASAPRPLIWLRERAALMLMMAVVAGAIIAVPALLTLQFLMDSNRPSISFGYAVMGSLVPENLATLLSPNIFGTLDASNDYWGPMWDTVPEGTWTDRSIGYLFVGTASAVLLIWQGIAERRLLDREIRFFVGLLAVALLYALGRYTPIFEVIFDRIPGVKLYRRPADATFVINVALGFIVGYCLHAYLRGAREPISTRLLRFASSGIALLLPALTLGYAVLFSYRVGKGEFALSAALWTSAGAIVILGGLWIARRRDLRPWAAVVLIAVTGGELAWRNAASALNAEPASRYSVYETLTPVDYAGLDVLRHELAARHERGEHPRVEILGLSGAWQNAAMVFGIEDTVGYNALRLADYEKIVGVGENAVETELRKFPGTFRGYRCRLSKLLGLEYLVLDRPAAQLPAHFPRLKDAQLLYGAEHMYIYRLQDAAPRAYLATAVKPLDTAEAMEAEEFPDFDRTNEVLLDPSEIESLKTTYPDAVDADATDRRDVKIEAYHRNSIEIAIDSESDGVLVLHDLYYPGWTVSIDGESAKLLRANILFRGVEVPAGKHHVVFAFRPLSPNNLMAAAEQVFSGHRESDETDDATTR